ncbi:UDP-glycosyltransferase 92A1 [Camellia lanceoleosa]|uniref:UDP-glycosyltransferase 92A1 n=1 Tax=Camellia lanceoleosa TaxID=1840588 RepID=A0ACC0IR70_9ERIC|nr:UDP-glycosyltransferase 92A1 [Camellia lanceoleosa]
MNQLAMGLEASGKPFIWVLRPPLEFSVTEEFNADWLPDRFEERIRAENQAMSVHKWALQQEILIPQIQRSIPQSLWLELHNRELEPGCCNFWVAAGCLTPKCRKRK